MTIRRSRSVTAVLSVATLSLCVAGGTETVKLDTAPRISTGLLTELNLHDCDGGGLWPATDDDRSTDPVLADDASRLFFTKVDGPYDDSGAPSAREVWVVDLRAGAASKFLEADQVGELAVSPDGMHVAFTALGDEGAGLRLYVASVAEPSEVRMIDAPTECGEWQSIAQPAWSPDGASIAYVHYWEDPLNAERTYALRVVDLASGQDEAVYEPGPHMDLLDPHWLADGQHIALTGPSPDTFVAPRHVIIIDRAGVELSTSAAGLAGGAELASLDGSVVVEIGDSYRQVEGVGDVVPPPVLRSWHHGSMRETALPDGWAYASELTIANCSYT